MKTLVWCHINRRGSVVKTLVWCSGVATPGPARARALGNLAVAPGNKRFELGLKFNCISTWQGL